MRQAVDRKPPKDLDMAHTLCTQLAPPGRENVVQLPAVWSRSNGSPPLPPPMRLPGFF